jgi:hypothetical protein
MNSNGNNGWRRNGAVGVTEHSPDSVERGDARDDPFAHPYIAFDAESGETEDATGQSSQRRTSRRRKRVIGGLLCLLLVVVTGVCLWVVTGDHGKTKINLPVKDASAQAAGAGVARNPDDVTAEAIAEIRSAAPTPAPAASIPPLQASGSIAPTTPVTVPLKTFGGTVLAAGKETPPEINAGQPVNSAATAKPKAASLVSERNSERSIRCAVTAPSSNSRSITKSEISPRSAGNPAREPETILAVPTTLAKTGVSLPSFGALLPVRTLGAIYTLRSGSLARFELTRDVRGPGWELKKGVTIIGRQQGGEYDRAYITLVGFIDPGSGKLVKIGGDVLGSDGAPGLRGKRRQVNSRWTRVLGRAAQSAVSLGQAALSRGGTTVILPGAVSPELSPGFNAINRREFVEIPAGAFGYVMITDLPQETHGVDADPLAKADGETLADEELAELLSSGSPEKIRAALPRMNPEMKRLALMVLQEK